MRATFAAMFLAASAALAQGTSTIEGRLFDIDTGEPLRAASVVASGPMGEHRALAGDDGEFRLSLLPPGSYTLDVQREGFSSFTLEGVRVRAGQTVRIDRGMLRLGAAGAAQTSRWRPAVERASGLEGGFIPREQMELIPYGRAVRSFLEPVRSIPGVAPGFRMLGTPDALLSLSGVERARWPVLQDFVEEVDVVAGGSRAEFGRSSGGMVDAVLRSGTNQIHGSAFAHALSSPEAWDGGAQIGGPIVRDRAWFMAGAAPVRAAGQTDLHYAGQVSARPADDHLLSLSAFNHAGSLQYLGKLFQQQMDVQGALWWQQGDGVEGSLKLTNLVRLAGRHELKYGGESWGAAFAQDRWRTPFGLLIDAGVRAERVAGITTVMPRLGAVYDLTGRGQTAAYAFYGRFEDLQQALAGIRTQVLGDGQASLDYVHTNLPYDTVIAALQKPFAESSLLRLSYAWPHAVKADLAYVYEWTAKTSASLGASFRAIEGTPWDVQLAARAAVTHALSPALALTALADGFTNPAAVRGGLRLSF